jgi:hypothetical protein
MQTTLSKAQARFGAIAKGEDTGLRAAQPVDVASALQVQELDVSKPLVAATKKAFPKLDEVDASSGMTTRPEVPPHESSETREKMKKDIAAMLKR